MEHNECGTISPKSIFELTDIPMYKSTMSMSKHIHDFESDMVTHYRIEGVPVYYVVQPKLMHLLWHMMQPQNLRENIPS